MSDKPILIVDSDFLIDIFGRNGDANMDLGNATLTQLTQKYDIQITRTVLDEVSNPASGAPPNRLISEDWFNNNATIHETPDFPAGVANNGEASIKSLLDNGVLDPADTTVASRDGFWDNSNQGGQYSDSRTKTQDLINQNLLDDVLEPSAYDNIRAENSGFPVGNETQPANQTIADHWTSHGVDAEALPDGKLRIGEKIFDSAQDIVGKGVKTVLKTVGPIALMIAISESAQAAENGNYDEAMDILASYGLGEVAGTVAGGASGGLAFWILQGVTLHPAAKVAVIAASALLGGAVADATAQAAYEEAIQNLRDLGIIPEDLFDDLMEGNIPSDPGITDPETSLPVEPVIPLPNQKPLPTWKQGMVDDWPVLITTGSPLVLDLDGDGIELASVLGADAVYWDIDQDGYAETSGWITGGDGLLAIDLNGDGAVNGHGELFGTLDTDGFTVLSSYDTNTDSVINASDAQFGDLLVWVDTNADGVSQDTELHTLTELGISEIALNAALVNYDIAGNIITHESTFTINGQTRTIVDAWFAYDNTNSQYAEDYTLDIRTLFLPTLRGFGDVKDLHIAMSQDETLLNMVQDVALADAATILDPAYDLTGKIEDILYRWAGVDGVDPASRGPYIDGRVIEFLEHYHGLPYIAYGHTSPTEIVTSGAAPAIVGVFNDVVEILTSHLLVQGAMSSHFPDGASYSLYDGEIIGSDINRVNFLDDSQTYAVPSTSGDAYVFNGGNITFNEQGGTDSLWIAGVQESDIRLEKYAGVDLRIHVDGQTITINDQFYEDQFNSDYYNYKQVETLVLDNGTTIDLLNNLTFRGSENGEYVYGTKSNDTLIGGQGNDNLRGDLGDDTYIWSVGDGSDTITEYGGIDQLVLHGATESDIRFENYNNQTLKLHIGAETITLNNQLYYDHTRTETLLLDDGTTVDLLNNLTFTGTSANDYIFGTDTNDTLVGAEGADYLYGYDGDDIYEWSVGDGNDKIYEAGGVDQIALHGVILDDIEFNSGSNHSLLITVGSETINIHGQYQADYYNNTGYAYRQIETLALDDGTVIDLLNGMSFTGDANVNNLVGYSGDDTLYGLGGNDYLTGNNGNDTLVGGVGADQIYGGDGANTFVFESASVFSGEDKLMDFDVSEGDALDIADVLTGYDPLTDIITDFVRITESGGHSYLAIDHDGGGNNYIQVAKFNWTTGLTDEQSLETSGNLIAA